MARTPFKLRSGNATPFKSMGSSPMRQEKKDIKDTQVGKFVGGFLSSIFGKKGLLGQVESGITKGVENIKAKKPVLQDTRIGKALDKSTGIKTKTTKKVVTPKKKVSSNIVTTHDKKWDYQFKDGIYQTKKKGATKWITPSTKIQKSIKSKVYPSHD